MQTQEFLLQTHIKAEALNAWREASWLLPAHDAALGEFSEIDLARAQLILDLQGIGVNDEAIPIVLDLIDQVHGLRRQLRWLISITKQDETATVQLLRSSGDQKH